MVLRSAFRGSHCETAGPIMRGARCSLEVSQSPPGNPGTGILYVNGTPLRLRSQGETPLCMWVYPLLLQALCHLARVSLVKIREIGFHPIERFYGINVQQEKVHKGPKVEIKRSRTRWLRIMFWDFSHGSCIQLLRRIHSTLKPATMSP